MHRTIFRSPSQQPDGSPGPNGRRPADPTDGQDILQRFTEMLMNDFRAGPPGRSGPDVLFPPDGDNHGFGFAGPPRVHRTTFMSPGGGTASFTIATAPLTRGGPGNFESYVPRHSGSRPAAPGVVFLRIANAPTSVFGNIMGDIPPPAPRDASGGEGPQVGGIPPGFPASLHQILSAILNPASAIHGDAVYSQEALDRIITSLMEANPQSNAAPPASQVAIEKLQRRKLDDDLLSSDGENSCSICIENMHKGDEAVVLPCKHWFHDECVTLWLKQHNTCPVCRRPIEGSAPRDAAPQQPAAAPESRPQGAQQSGFYPAMFVTGPAPATESNTPHRRQPRGWRSAAENEERLNAIRNAGGAAYAGSSSTNRRSSHSPPRPRVQTPMDQASRATFRQRSPSPEWRFGQGSQRHGGNDSRDRGSNSSGSGSGSSGPFSWLRDHLRGNNNNNNNNNGSRR